MKPTKKEIKANISMRICQTQQKYIDAIKMKKINIKIPDDLSPKEEALLIAQRLNQKMLAGHGRQMDKLRIGTQVDIKHLTTQITIERTGDKPIEMVTCNVCGCDYQNNTYKGVWVNYGGERKEVKTCSENCGSALIDLCGIGRAAFKKKDLHPFRFY